MEMNAGYEIVNSIIYNEPRGVVLGYVVGKIPNEERYVTWMKNERGYDRGHYDFKSYEDAFLDMTKRAFGYELWMDYRKEMISEMLEEYGCSNDVINHVLENEELVENFSQDITEKGFEGYEEEVCSEMKIKGFEEEK